MSVRPKRLLAKSSETPDAPHGAELLRGHTAYVVEAAKQLLTHRADDALRALGLSESLRARLERWVLAAAFVHDLGKCSAHFQETVRRRRDVAQLVRHEACSLYLTWPGQPLGDWLAPAFENERDHRFAVIAAAGHHRKFWHRAIAHKDDGAGTTLTLWTSHEDFRSTLELGAKALSLLEPPTLSDITLEHRRSSAVEAFFQRCEDEVEDLAPTDEERALLAVAKALVLDADVAGSALPRAAEKPGWIRVVLERPRDPADLEALVEQRLGGHALRPFQLEVAGSTAPVALVRAGCGTGKTVAAYAWAARSHPGRTLWVTYPTTGTATEGFRDYIFEASVRGRLEHGRSEVDIEIFGLHELNDATQDDLSDALRDTDRLDALRAWDMDVVACTVDTVLGLMQNQRKGLYAFPSLVRSAVVFDEVHAYDDELFGALLRFLANLPGVPTLLMTASLPDAHLRALDRVVQQAHGRPLHVIEGPEDLETLPRYRRVHGDPWAHVHEALKQNGKILWVSNTVDRCIAVGDRALAAPTLIYHSRFRYEDRVARHGAVISAFKGSKPALASTTQVAEMSLDLSADLLVTDLAPIPALIQRLGRLNRRSRPDDPKPVAPFVVIEPERALPYSDRELAEARAWLERLGDRPLSQRDLIEAWTTSALEAPPPAPSAWLDGVFCTEPAAVRGASPGVTVILEEDQPRVTAKPSFGPRLAVPMGPPPRAFRWRTWPRAARIYPVAPAGTIHYDPQRGAQWRAPA